MVLVNMGLLLLIRLFLAVIKLFSLGSGSTWPGHIALKLNKNFIKQVIENSQIKCILVAGTNGKTTTSSLLRFILEKKSYRVFQNEEGANLLNGIASSIIKHADLSGRLPYDYTIFEVDENSLPLVLQQMTPDGIIVLNLFRDQLDRYGEVNTIATKWRESFRSLPPTVNLFLNGDDPQIHFLGKDTKAAVHYFGLSEKLMEKKEIPHDVDSINCPVCGERLEYEKMSYSHLGIYLCKKCGFTRERVVTYDAALLDSKLRGLYNLHNISAAFLAAETLVNSSLGELQSVLKEFKPAFGRQEVIEYKDRKFFLLLSKNPTGFNQSIEAIKEMAHGEKLTVLLLLNDQIPDGRDISWIWDVEFQESIPFSKNLIISGDRAYDMALRLKYCFDKDSSVEREGESITFENVVVIEGIGKTLQYTLKNTDNDETVVVLATYSAMLEIRELLVGRKLL